MIEEITGMKVNTLHYYIKGGAIIPDIRLGEGTGKSREFSETNCLEVIIINRLMNYGIPRRTIIEIFKKIRKNGERGRLDPRKICNAKTTEYLLIYIHEKEFQGFRYRFVSDGGEKYSPTYKKFREERRIELTSYNGIESLMDFISFPYVDTNILINLSSLWPRVPIWRQYKLGDRFR
ncbi:MAG: MerR family transcriptional regulator [Desulfobacterales bacterium]